MHNPSAIAVTGFNMITGLGLDAATSCASVRAATSRTQSFEDFTVFASLQEPNEPLSAVQVPVITKGLSGQMRQVTMAQYALLGLLQPLPITPNLRTGLWLNIASGYFQSQGATDSGLPEVYQQAKQQLELLHAVASVAPFQWAHQSITAQDQTGFITTLQQAAQMLQQRRLDRCIIGGVDSYIDLDVLDTLNQAEVLKTPVNSNGFIPGEGAGFLVLERYDLAKQRGTKIYGVIASVGTAEEPSHRLDENHRALGMALGSAVIQSLSGISNPSINLVLSSLNGDTYRSTDWGYALIRAKSKFPDFGDHDTLHPVRFFGETNAAHGFLASCLVLQGYNRGYVAGSALLMLQNEDGKRGAVILEPRSAQ